MEGARTTDHGGNDERAAAHHRGYPLFEADYQLLEEIGHAANGSSIVFRAICLPNNEVVAIKCLDPATCHRTPDQVRAEATALSLISHPNVLRAYCSFVAKNSLWVVMPYMAGGSCVHIMKAAFADGFEEPVVATILKETLKGLNYLHQHGHIHRDVKARNILIDENGVVKLGDLGISPCISDMGDLQQPRNDFEGTRYWMAPEVMEQLHGYDSRADIWSFGIAALELAHGCSPFSKYPPSKDVLMTFQTCLSLLDETCAKSCSSSFKEMVAICLVKDPSKRPTAEQLLSHPFFKKAQTYDFIRQNVLDGLPPLAERAKQLKIIDAARLALKRTSFSVDKLQTGYKRVVSKWNLHVEDVKAEGTVVACGGDPSDIEAQGELDRGDYCIQRKSGSSLEVIDIIAERDAAVLEKSIALSEKMAAYQERDSAIIQRDLALVDRDAAILSRDAAIATLARLERKAAGRSRKKPQAPQDGLMHGSKMLQRVELTENCSLASECHPSAGHASHSGIMVLDAESTHCQAGIHRFGRDKEPDIEIFVRTKRKGANLTDVTVRGKHSQPPPKKSRNWPLTHQGQQQPGHHPEGVTQVDDEEEEGQIREPELLKSRVYLNTPIPYCSCTGLNQQCYRWGNGGWQSACCTTMISMFPLPMNPKKRGSRLAGRKMSAGAFEKLLEKLVLEGVNISHPVDLREHWAKHGTNRYVTLR